MKHLILMAALAAPVAALAACGGEDTPATPAAKMTPSEARPPAPVASGMLGRIARTDETHTRLALVDLTRDQELETPLQPGELRRVVLGAPGAKLADAAGSDAAVAVAAGGATLLEQPGGEGRTVSGGSPELRAALEDTAPQDNASEDETTAATQACLGDSIAQVITGPSALGRNSAIGVGVADADDPPRGPQLRVCVAPLRVKALHRAEHHLGELFPAKGPTAQRPVIAEQEIGEREIVSAYVSLDQVDAAVLRDLLAGGDAVAWLVKP